MNKEERGRRHIERKTLGDHETGGDLANPSKEKLVSEKLVGIKERGRTEMCWELTEYRKLRIRTGERRGDSGGREVVRVGERVCESRRVRELIARERIFCVYVCVHALGEIWRGGGAGR